MSDKSTDNRSYPGETYALSGKIMLTSIVILFTVVILIICLHIYARWFLARTRRRQQQELRTRRRRANIIFTSDIPNPAADISHGLDASLLKTLPTFIYTTTAQEGLECAVCLSEFEENEKGRLLPKCNHSFHIGCIDMWFHSHSTCPLCRAPIEQPQPNIETAPVEIVIDSAESPTECEETSSENMESCSSSSNLAARRKGMGVSIEVPRRTEETLQGSPVGVFKSPGGRILSFKRLLTRDRRQQSIMEIDLEIGEIDEPVSGTPTYLRQREKVKVTSESVGVGG